MLKRHVECFMECIVWRGARGLEEEVCSLFSDLFEVTSLLNSRTDNF